MMDLEKMLGGLLNGGLGLDKNKKKSKLLKKSLKSGSQWIARGSKTLLSGSSSKPGMKPMVGMGLLGVALAAYEHYTQQNAAPSGTPMGGGASRFGTPPPPPPGTGGGATPPPPPGARTGSVVAGGGEVKPTASGEELLLLIRAMIAAAYADGVMDDAERSRILKRFEKAGLEEEEKRFLVHELTHPLGLEELVRQVKSPELARQIYACTLAAIEIDTEEEHRYLERLAEGLGLERNTVLRIQEEMELKEIHQAEE